MADTGIRTPDPGDENQDHDDGGIGLPVAQEAESLTPESPEYYEQRIREKLAELNNYSLNLTGREVTFVGSAQLLNAVQRLNDQRKESEETQKVPTPTKLYGMALIKDMSDDELVEELLAHQRDMFSKMDRQDLIQSVMGMRVSVYKHRLISESGLDWSVTLGE